MRSLSIAIPTVGGLRSYLLPALATGAALAAAIVGAALTGESSTTGGLNGIIENLSGGSSSYLGDIAPLGFAFAAGMVATVNPCGFAMLPAYLGLYLGSSEDRKEDPIRSLSRALLVGTVVTSAFILLFGVAGIIIAKGTQAIVDIIPWLGLAIGVLIAIVGSWLLGGGKLYTSLPGRAAARMGNPGQVSVKGYFLFGLSYAVASLSCALPIFLVVVVTSQAVSGFWVAVGEFFLYALGMGLVIMVLTIGMALFKGAVVTAFRKMLPYMQPVSAVVMILAGSYIVYYWLTIGDLGGGL